MCFFLSGSWFWEMTEPLEGAAVSEIPHGRKPATSQEPVRE